MAEAASEDMTTMENVAGVDKSGSNLSLSELALYFHLPIAEAAQRIKVCATVLKKVCRKNNIPRWPHRKIKSFDRAIQSLTDSLGMNPDQDVVIRAQLADLQQKKAYVMQNPESIVSGSKKKRSNPVYSMDSKKNRHLAPLPRERDDFMLTEAPPMPNNMPSLALDSVQPFFAVPSPAGLHHFDPYAHHHYYYSSAGYHNPYSSLPPAYYSPSSEASHSPHSPHSPHSTGSSSSASTSDGIGLIPYMQHHSSFYPPRMIQPPSHEGTTEGY